MLLKKSVQTKIFFGFISMLCANIVMISLWFFHICDMELNLKLSFIIGGILGFFLEHKLNVVEYDEIDNNNILFFIFFLLLLTLLVIQAVFLPQK